MIMMTLGQVVTAEPALARLAEDNKLPLQASYQMSKLLRAVGDELKHFHDARNKLVREYGAIPDGGTDADLKVEPTAPRWAEFCAKVDELVAVQVSLAFNPIDLAAIPNLTIAPADLLRLAPLTKEHADGK